MRLPRRLLATAVWSWSTRNKSGECSGGLESLIPRQRTETKACIFLYCFIFVYNAANFIHYGFLHKIPRQMSNVDKAEMS